MANSYTLEIVTPEKLFYMGEVEQVIVRTLDGEEAFMAHHSWACKLLATGELWIMEAGSKDYKIAALSGGFVDVRDSVIIYSDSAEWPEDVDEDRAKKAKTRAEERIKGYGEDLDINRAKLAIIKANTRINIKGGSGRRKR